MTLTDIGNELRYKAAARSGHVSDDSQPARPLRGLYRVCVVEEIVQEVLRRHEEQNEAADDDGDKTTTTIH